MLLTFIENYIIFSLFIKGTRLNVSHEIFWPTVQAKINSWPRPVRLEFFRPGSMISKDQNVAMTMAEVVQLTKEDMNDDEEDEVDIKKKKENENCGGEYKMTRTGTEIQEYPTNSCSPTNVFAFKTTNQPTPL